MKQSARRFVQHAASIVIAFAILLLPDSSLSFGSRAAMAGLALLAFAAISSRRLRDANLLVSPLDFGLLPYVLLTGLTVFFAASPRRSLESWLWVIALQLPIGYGALYLFRRHWHERTIYRALLIAGGYMYVFAAELTLNYLSEWLTDRTEGIAAPGFRLWGVTNHPNIFAMVIAVSTPCMVGYLFLRMRRLERFAVVLWLAGAALALFGTGSRTGLVATMIGVVVGFSLALLAHPAQPLARFYAWVHTNRRQAVALIVAGSTVVIVGLGTAIYLQFGRPMQDNGGGRLTFFKSAVTMFVARPLVGAGPGGFVRNDVQTHSVPPWRPWPHAHNMFLNTAAESGLTGLVGFVALLIVATCICVVVWRRRPSMKPLIAGPIGGLVGFCLNGLLDSPINQFGPFSLATALLAFIAAMLPPPGEIHRTRARLIVGSLGAIVVMLGLVLVPYTAQWDSVEPDGSIKEPSTIAANARLLDTVMVVDRYDPLIALQSAYQWAAVAVGSGQSNALDTAIARFERGVQLDPDLGINYLNLSSLYIQAERLQDAVRAAQQAIEHSTLDGVAWLNLGIVLEKIGKDDDAQTAYVRSLQLQPWSSSAGFWQVSPMRRTARLQYLALSDRSFYYELLIQGDAARLSGPKDQAIRKYEEALKIAPGPVASVYVQGLIALAGGDLVGAHGQMTKVTAMDIVETPDQLAFANAWLCLGDLAGDQGNQVEMLQDYARAYYFLTTRGLGGFGTKYSPVYALIGYQRYGQITDYLPGVVMVDIGPGQATRFKMLASAAKANGKPAEAADIYRHILQSNPDDAEAKVAMVRWMP